MRKVRKLTALGLTAFFLSSISLYGAERIAVVTKVKGTVELRKSGSNFKLVTPGIVLFDQDFIKTGSDGFMVMVYLDDKSMLKIKQNTNLQISGTRKGKGISKKIDMIVGTLKAEISKERRGDFIISTPTTVASVKGTIFWFISNPLFGDQVIGLEGLIELQNLISGEVIIVGAGMTGISTPTGDLELQETIDSDIPEDEDEAEEEINELKVRLKDAFGEEKVFIIKYR
ncbi:MAG: FecR domain-containing protein [Candidatus Marinimicrobia bacterium]|nr:FecR domain-containing protein [Candidatus Neomarinimicrobiota bacterium]